ncbi:MAG: exosome protein [Methanobacterium sp.]|nr:exosome protein [Methanobacterium sp.]
MIHNISYRTFVNGTENEEKVRKAVKTLFPNSLPQKEYIEGYYKNPVLVLHGKIVKKQDIKDFISTIKDQKSTRLKILNELDKKLDDKGNLFLRFDKQKAYLGEFKIIEHGDSIHLKIKIAAYPAKKKPALKIVWEIWGE